MTSDCIRRFTAAAILVAAAVTDAFAQGVTLVAQPSSLTFNVLNGTPPAQDVVIKTSTDQAAQITITSATAGVSWTLVEAPNGQAFTPQTIRVSVNPATLPVGTLAGLNITTSIQGIAGITVPINITGTGGGTGAFTVNPTSLAFTQTGTTPPAAQTLFVSSNTGLTPAYHTSITYVNGSNWLSVSPPPLQTSSSATVTVTPNSSALTTGTYQANLTLTPVNITAAAITVPISLSVNQAGTTPLTVSPSSIFFSFVAGTTTPQGQALFVSSGATPVAFTASLSSTLVGIVQVSGAQTTPTQLTVGIPFPQFVLSGTTGTLTLTPTAGSGFGAVSIPIQINSGFGGLGLLNITPSSLTFTGPLGSTPPAQNLTVTSPDAVSRFFQATATSTNNFLFVNSSSGVTPGTVTVGVNMSAITQPGTYFGTVTVTPFGTGAGIPSTIQVTLNATSALTVTPDPTSVSLSAGAGTAAVQRNVFLNSTTSNIPFTASVSTTTGESWLSVSSNNAFLPATLTITANPANLAPGTYNGTVTVTAQSSTVATIPVTFTVTAAATLQLSPAALTFNHQTTSTSQPAAQSIQVTSSGPAITWNATAESTGGWLQVTPSTGTTPGTLNVSVNATGITTAGTYTGTVRVTSSAASNSPRTATVTLIVTTPLIPQVRSLVNAASGTPTVAAPGLIAAVFGSDLGPAQPVTAQVNAAGFIDTTLGGVRVLFDGIPAPVLYASATQVNVVVPYEIAGRFSTRMVVEARNQRSPEIELRVADTAPGIFTSNGSGSGQGAILNQNNTVNSPANPEQRGNVIVIYATGHGQTTPPGTTGRVMPPAGDLRQANARVVVRIGGREAEIFYAGSAPGLISGALQINARIPLDAPTGSNVPVEVQIGGVVSQQGVTIAIQ